MQFRTKLQEKLLDLNTNLPGGLKWIFITLIKHEYPSLSLFSRFIHHHHFHFFFLSLISQPSLLDNFFIWRLISNPSDLMVHPQHKLPGDNSRQSDPPLFAPYISQNHVGLNEGELVLTLTHLHLHRSSQAGDEVGFLIPLLLFYKFFTFA